MVLVQLPFNKYSHLNRNTLDQCQLSRNISNEIQVSNENFRFRISHGTSNVLL